jgi:hypothetical protein
MKQPFSNADHISQVLQTDFDTMLRNTLGKYHSFSGFALLLGGFLQYMNARNDYTFLPEMTASLYLGRQRGEGYIFDDTGFSGLYYSHANGGRGYHRDTPGFLTYFAGFLENPERSEAHTFDQQRYTTASKECLQLCLCNHQGFSKGAAEYVHRDKAVRRSKPSIWLRRLGVHSRIMKAGHQLKVRQLKSLKAKFIIDQHASLPHDSAEHDFCRSLSYRWSLDLLPFFLERSAISLELVDVLDRCTFTTMAQKFPRRVRLAKEAIAKYILRVEESGVSKP